MGGFLMPPLPPGVTLDQLVEESTCNRCGACFGTHSSYCIRRQRQFQLFDHTGLHIRFFAASGEEIPYDLPQHVTDAILSPLF